ncbi:Ppx/GppA phosphatase family protein [Mesorhizobium sp. WSM4935]|uniref:Ppx/GppA phosphatase family protein n=1 Tax=Mesorhizobium sp. WSM4935 TaxID=3038547 RepID=UPI0024153655|nr:Ppx/GppA phosphatase family protein [Mesorhizobium sp. WSM4935]MDG4877691.1 Ppx/GppA phosphatase family protein [Mesorhizobium sp. WSM4935]
MEDHDTGAGASAVGMSGASPAQSAGPHPARFSRHAGAHQRHADPRHAGQRQTGQADQHGDQPKGKTRKRRKRKRGRKVFARDVNGAVPNAAPAATTAASQPQSVPSPVEPRPAAPQRPPQQELPVFAALDLGTNNCRLLVAVPGRHGQFRVIDAFSRIVRLGEGLTASGRLGQAAMDRAVEALKICGEKLRNRKIRKARLIATEACRSAANGVEFLDRVEREAGLKLEIIDRQTEARLAVSGCGSLVERDTQGVVLFDIGGGSSEIALIDLTGRRSPRLANHIVSWTSLPVGVVSLAERFGGRTVTRETFAAMVDDVATRLKAFDGRDRLAHVLASPNFHLLGTSGTVTTLAGVHLDLERYDRRRVDGLWMDRDSVDRMIERLIGWDFQQRCANPCIGADRADLVLAGCAILEAIRGVWPSERLRVADRGLREGILSELMADDGVWRNDGRGR